METLYRYPGNWLATLLAAGGALALADDSWLLALDGAVQQYVLPGYMKLLLGPVLCS